MEVPVTLHPQSGVASGILPQAVGRHMSQVQPIHKYGDVILECGSCQTIEFKNIAHHFFIATTPQTADYGAATVRERRETSLIWNAAGAR